MKNRENIKKKKEKKKKKKKKGLFFLLRGHLNYLHNWGN